MNISAINYLFTAVFLFSALMLWYRAAKFRHKKINWDAPAAHSLLRISVPKNNDRTPQAAEQMFASLHGIFRSGAEDQSHLSFEIVSKNKTINFYAYVPTDVRDFVSSQIFAQYPTVEITEIAKEDDYTALSPEKHIAATELDLKKTTAYPLKTFQNFEVDPLSSITGALSSVTDQEEIWIQVLVKPIDDDWQELGKKEIKAIKEPGGKHVGFGELIAKESKALLIEGLKNIVSGPTKTDDKKKDEKKKDDKDSQESAAAKAIEEKITKLGFATNIRILAASTDEFAARAKLEQVVGAFKQFNTINLNALIAKDITSDAEAHQLFTDRAFGDSSMIFNITELASLYHYPAESVVTPTIAWAGSKKGEPPANLPVIDSVPAEELTVFAETNFRNEVKKFGIKKKDRRLHTYIIGKTGTGKSTLMENMIIDDITEGRGMAVVDPHGSLIQHVLEFIPESRVHDVIYFNPADHEFPVGFNLLENVNPEQKNIVASGVVGILEKIFGEVSWGPRLEYILRNVILALLEYPNSTFMGIMRLLTDNAYRRMVLNEVKDPVIRDFFINEYEKYEPKFRTEAIAPIQNKVGQFLSASTIRNIIGQPKSTIDIRKVMDEGKILLADLSIGKIGEDNSALLGSMLITKIQLAAMGRVDIEEAERKDFYLYVDEFQNFATDSFATILSEARKYRLNLAMANQYTAQMPESVSNAVFGNVGTMISFRVGAQDANVLVKEFEPVFDANDLVNLDNYQIYLKMAIDGVTVPAFSASTLPPKQEKTNLVEEIIASSRQMYSRPISEVEDYITEWSAPINLSDISTRPVTQPYQELKTLPPTPPISTAQSGVGESNQKKEPELVKPAQMGESVKEGSQTSAAPAPAVVAATPLVTEQQPAQLPENKPNLPDLPAGTKVEIVKDRFDRPWYAVSSQNGGLTNPLPTNRSEAGEQGKAEEPISSLPDTPITAESGGGASEIPQLITWDAAEELGIEAPKATVNEPAPEAADDQLLPLDEIR